MYGKLLGNLVLGVYRFGNYVHYKIRIPVLRQLLILVYLCLDAFIVQTLAHAQIPRRAKIGPGLDLRHSGNGVIVNSNAVIGSNVVLYHQVTIGTLGGRENTGVAPVIGDRVMIGAGAKIIGPINIGDDVKIGANAVVNCNIPSGCTAVGVPARIIRRYEETSGSCRLDV